MATKTEFASLAQLSDYTQARGGGFEALTPSQKAYARINALCNRYNITLKEVKEGLAYMIEHATNATRKKIYIRIANAIRYEECHKGELQYSLCFGPGEHDHASCLDAEAIASLVGQYVGMQAFDITIMQDSTELGRGVYNCLNANSHWLRIVEETGQAQGLIEKIAVLAVDNTWVLKAKRIDADQPSVAIHYYEWLVFFAVPRTDAEKEAIQIEIQEMDEQARLLGFRFHLQNQEVVLDEIEE